MITETVAGPLTVLELRRQAVDVLRRGGIENPARETDWLLAHALDVRPHVLLLEGNRVIPRSDAERAWSLLLRRAAREPLQYLLTTQEFYGLEIAVTPEVLIPRPETEMLVEETVRAIEGLQRPVLVDVGTGSGCIVVSVLRECSGATAYALDLSMPALAVARRNASRHGVASRCCFLQADLMGAFSDLSGGRFDVVVSNPPYIPEGDLEGLQPEVSRYEPRLALAGGPDGLLFHRRLLAEAPPLLKRGGVLIIELGAGQSEVMRGMAFQVDAFASIEIREDAAGIPRVLVARKLA